MINSNSISRKLNFRLLNLPATLFSTLFVFLFFFVFLLFPLFAFSKFSEGKIKSPIKTRHDGPAFTRIEGQPCSQLSSGDKLDTNPAKKTRKESDTISYHLSWGQFKLTFSEKGLVSLKREADLYDTDYLLTGNSIGNVVVTYRLKSPARNSEDERSQPALSLSTSSSGSHLYRFRQLRDARLERAESERVVYRIHPPYFPFLSKARISASVQSRDFSALIDEMPVVDSKSRSARFFSFNPKKGTTEWVQCEFPEPTSVSAAEVYWVDDSELNGPYKVPSNWRILYRDSSGNFVPVRNPSGYGKALDRLNRVTFEPVRTDAVRLEVQLEPGYTAGLYEWQVETDLEAKTKQEYERQKKQAEKEIRVESIFQPEGNALLWSVSIQNLTNMEMELADLGLPLPFNTQYGWDKEVTYNLRVIRHFLVAGHGSFVFCERTNAEPPYLLMIPVGEAYFEYFDDSGRGIFCPYVHSKRAVEQAISQGGRWRFPSTAAVLKPRGQKGDRLTYKFKFLWAEKGYQSVRDLLYEEGKFDVQVVPGMVVPENLEALLAIRTKNKIEALIPEFPGQTSVEDIGKGEGVEREAAISSCTSYTNYAASTTGATSAASNTSADSFACVTNPASAATDTTAVSPCHATSTHTSAVTSSTGTIAHPTLPAFHVVVNNSDNSTNNSTDISSNISSAADSAITTNAGGMPKKCEVETRSASAVQVATRMSPSAISTEQPSSRSGYRLFRIRFSRLGENLITVRCAGGLSLPLEFFVTEDLETLFKKRAAFLVRRQQHRDPSKWYYGVFSDWDMKNKVLRSADDRDGLQTWLVDACDDAGNARPAFVASKNVYFPNQEEVAAVDLYIKHYLWGGMQMTEDEPYPFAIYGIPNWKVNRESPDPGRNGRLHIWRIYDYPHIVLLYYRMYQVARLYPKIKTELTAEEYLRRAYRTAIAYFTVPLKVEGWSAYETPTMNEIVMNELIDALEREGWKKEAAELRAHWEKKVLHFVNDEPYLFGSEFAFDSTGFEATGAMARYAMKKLLMREQEKEKEKERAEQAGELWSREKAEKFLEKQVRLNVAARGWLETAYYYLGSDYRAGGGLRYTLSYMSQMGGWSLLDYALWWAKDRQAIFDYLRLGYASYLSSWALVNSGRPETNYGYWYPGEENDGAAAGGFEPLAWARCWNGKWIPRGAWNYSAEEDVGYCGAVRDAATVVAEDPVFGTVALGGKLEDKGDRVEVIPRDGLRVRLHYVRDERQRLHLEFEKGRLAAEKPAVVARDFSEIKLWVELRDVEEVDGAEAERAELGKLEGAPAAGSVGLEVDKKRSLVERSSAEKGSKYEGKKGSLENARWDEVVLVIWGLQGEYEIQDGSGMRVPVEVQADGALRVRCTPGPLLIKKNGDALHVS